MPGAEYTINKQFDVLRNAYRRLNNSSFDVTSGLYGEQARLQRQVGSTLAAVGSNVGGTGNKLPLFQIGADFAQKRIMARTAYEQAKFQNYLNIASLFGQNAQLKLQKNAMDYEQAFNIGDILGLFNINANINPFGGNSNQASVPATGIQGTYTLPNGNPMPEQWQYGDQLRIS